MPTQPTTPDELHNFITTHLNLQLPRQPLLDGHTAPFDYLCHAFFEPLPSHSCPSAGASPSARGEPAEVGRARPVPYALSPVPSSPPHDLTTSPPHLPPRDCIVWANRGGGKTLLGAVATFLDMLYKPGIAIRILGGSLEQSRRMHHHLARLFAIPPFDAEVAGRILRDRITLINGSTCEILAQSETSVRGTRIQKLRCDEVELFNPDVWEAAQLVTRSAQCGNTYVHGAIECLSTMHRPYGLMFQLVKEASEGTRTLFRWGVLDVLGPCTDAHICHGPHGAEDNPCPLWDECRGRIKLRDAAPSPPGHLHVADAIVQKRRVDPATWNSEMLCLRPSRTDTVLPEFSVNRHVVHALPAAWRQWPHVGGMDFGFRGSAVILRAAVSPDGAIYIYSEWVERERLFQDAVVHLHDASHPPLDWLGVDPSGNAPQDQTGKSNVEVLRHAGFIVRSRASSISEGLSLLRYRFVPGGPHQAPRLFILDRCTKLIEALERYHYPKDKPESLVPVKDGHDHLIDALRYLVLNHDRPYQTQHQSYLHP